MIHHATTVLVCTALAAGLTFVTRYLLTRWFRTPMGRHAMAFGVVACILLTLGVSRELFGADWAGREWVRLVAYVLVNGVLWWQVWLLFAGQRAGRRGAMMTETNTPEEPDA